MKEINPRKALNPAYRKHKPNRDEVNRFIEQLKQCLEAIKLIEENNESEEHLKEPVRKFLRATFYKDHYINTKQRIDLAVYLGENSKSDVGILIEAKKPGNKAEFLTTKSLNRKALHELLLYYLRERIDRKNNNIKHLITTNGYEWFLFKGEDFYNLFYKNKSLVKEYEAFRDGLKDSPKNELFYNEIAKKHIAEIESKLPFVHLNFSETNFDTLKDSDLNTLYKIFSDVHLLGHSFGNDSNQLNKAFYNELLHIIGLEEVKEKGKKLIRRKEEKNRDYASLLESTIYILENHDYLRNIKSIPNGQDKAFNVGLELCLTWVNRILFLKLLESQLLTYHKGAAAYKFLHSDFIKGFDHLNDLFFSALARKPDERSKHKKRFQYIPYLNSSLFERNTLEDEAFVISALDNDQMIVYTSTVLKDSKGKRLKGELNTLDYLFKFLDAYDFTTDGAEGITDEKETKSLINASVLGLIFEKINGYKEGSFYTPGYITMYMCKETLRRAVVQKFKDQENDRIETFEDLQNHVKDRFKREDKKRFNAIINTLRICDPAVGSGHFLVSALNELIAIKSELRVLADAEGMSLSCDIQIENDELHITDDSGYLFEYNPNNKESQRIQQTLFHEKQTLIENCLFGVDINPNSVKICRLRLWIELLKNAYYTEEKQLQTLPNIDINIKCGNSLISRFDLNDDLKEAFKGKEVNYTFTDYKNAVAEYKNTNNRDRKREVLEIIEAVKNNFKSTLDKKFIEKFQKSQGAYINEQERQNNLEKLGIKITKVEKDHIKELKAKAEKASLEKEDILNNVIYRNAFEWRFEFPEILDKKGNFIGFDVVIGNPPYGAFFSNNEKDYIIKEYKSYQYKFESYLYFYEKGIHILRKNGFLSFITPELFLRLEKSENIRRFLLNNSTLIEIKLCGENVFDDVKVNSLILTIQKKRNQNNNFKIVSENENIWSYEFAIWKNTPLLKIEYEISPLVRHIIEKIEINSTSLGNLGEAIQGLTPYDSYKGHSKELIKNRGFHFNEKIDESCGKWLDGKHVSRYSLTEGNEWLKYGNWLAAPREKRFFEGQRLLFREVPGKNKRIQATYTKNTYYHGHSITPFVLGRNQPKDKLFEILGIVNSKLISWFTKYKSSNFSKNTFPKLNPKDIKSLPIPKNSINNDRLVKMVSDILEKKEILVALEWKFLKYLNSKNLAKKPNKKLETWHELTFEEFIKELNKAIKAVGGTPLTKKDEFEWLNLFEENQKKAQELKAEIAKTDAEIDQMVYKLYGLTEEEVQIVENS